MASDTIAPAATGNAARRAPPVWLILVMCCAVVSLTVYAVPWLRHLVTAAPPQRHPWWFVTALFTHADRTVIPLYLHFITNVAVIALFGSRVERRLGSARTALVVVTAVAAQLVVSRAIGTYGDGASGIAWAFAPLALPAVLDEYRRRRRAAFADASFLAHVVLYGWIWIVVTAASFAMGAHATNLWHLTATLVGVGFLLLWRRHLLGHGRAPATIADRRTRRIGLLLPALLVVLLVAGLAGLVRVRSPVTIAVDPESGDLAGLAAAGGRVVVGFSEPMMLQVRARTSVQTQGGEPLRVGYEWDDERTLSVRFSRPVHAGERVDVEFEGLRDASGWPVGVPVVLRYR